MSLWQNHYNSFILSIKSYIQALLTSGYIYCNARALITSDPIVADEVDAIRDKNLIDNLFFSGEREGWRDFRQEINKASGDLELEKLTSSDPFTINYTSGTTGAPKGVLHTHSLMYCFDRLNRYYWWGTQPDELCWATTEPGWAKWYWAPFGAIVDPGTGERVPVGKKGIIAVVRDHPMLFKGYHKKEEKTAECFVGDWYLTGDLAMMDEYRKNIYCCMDLWG